jgi:PAS domain S-box-containing protein
MATLRTKTLVIIYTVIISGGLLLYLTTNLLLSQSFARLEAQEAQENLQRVLNAVELEAQELNAGVTDWANWDDSYAFVQDANPDYIEINLTASTFANLHLNLMLFMNVSGDVIFARTYDAQSTRVVDSLPAGVSAYLESSSVLFNGTVPSNAVGILPLPDNPMLVASQPIHNSSAEGPVAGYLIWGRYLDSAAIKRLSTNTLLPITLRALTNLSADFRLAHTELSGEAQTFVRPLDEQTVVGYTYLHDITGSPAYIISVEAKRDITQTGQTAISHFVPLITVIGLLAGIAALLLLGRWVLAPLTELNKVITAIRTSGNLATRVPIKTRDEIAYLALSINSLLDSLQTSQSALENLNQNLEARIADRTASLMRTKEHVEAILNNSSDAILLTRSDGIIRQTNPAFNDLFGYRADETFGQKLNRIALNDNLSCLMEHLSDVVKEREPRRLEITVHRKDGTTFDADIALAPIVRTNPTVVEVICSLRDMTERKRMEAELRETLQKQKELNEFKSRFTSMVSHEFRTPLTTILSSSQLLQHYAAKLTEDKKGLHFQKIEASVRHLTEMLDDVLALGKAEAVVVAESTREIVDLEMLCRATIEEIQQSAGTSYKIVFRSEGEQPYLNGSEKLLRQAVSNLLSNAVKYSPQGGDINVELLCHEDTAFLRVQDYGIGIPKEEHSRLFTDFHRANNVGMIAGTGLGLVIVKRAVEAHGGFVTFESEVGVGTTFTVSLPLAPAYSAVSGGSV